MRLARSLALALAALVAAAPLSAQAPANPTSTSDVDPGAVRYFDPGGEQLGRIEKSLPFDVQFYLRIPVETDVRRMSGRYVGDVDPLDCGAAFDRWGLNVRYAQYGARPIARVEQREELPITFTRFVNVTEPEALVGRYAELNVLRGLLPNRYYCLELLRIRQPVGDSADFRRQLADAIDQLLRDRDELDDPSLEEEAYRQLRKDVIAALNGRLEDGERLIIPAGTFLDEEASDEAVPAESRRAFDEVIEAQKNRGTDLGNLGSSIQDTIGFVSAVLESPALDVLGQSAEISPRPADLQPVLQGREASLELATSLSDLLPGELPDVVSGQEAPSLAEEAAAPPLDAVWTPADLAPRAANLRALDTLLADLQSVAFTLARDDDLQTQLVGGGDDPGSALSALSENLFKARGEVEAVSANLAVLEADLERRQRKLMAMAEPIARVIIEKVLAEGTTTDKFEVRANWYLGMDLGVGWAEGIEDLFTYVGTNIYFRPVNKRAPLRWSDFRKGQRRSELLKRASVTIGLVINDLSRNCRFGDSVEPAACRLFEGVSQENITQGLVVDRPLAFLAGLRLNDFLRVSAGALIFKESNPDPLLGGSRLAWSPMVSISIDWNLRGSLRNRVTQQPFPTTETTE